MRRFELSEGSSHKFWEVAVEGTSMTTRWGRIGTTGQSKAKTFASTAKAQQEHDALVREKTGKGYKEVAAIEGSIATAPPAAQPPAPAPIASQTPPTPAPAASSTPLAPPAPAGGAAEDDPQPIAWTDALRRRIFPRRTSAYPAPSLDPARAVARLRAHYALTAQKWHHERSAQDKALAPLVDVALERLARTNDWPAPSSPLTEGVFLNVVSFCADWRQESVVDAVVDYWATTRGLTFAVEAAVASLGFIVISDHGNGPYVAPFAIVPGQRQQHPPFLVGRLPPWDRLRVLLATTEENVWREARDVATRLRADASKQVKTALAFAFPDVPEWAEEVAREAIAQGNVTSMTGSALASIRDADLQEQMVRAKAASWGLIPSRSHWKPEVLEMALTMIDGAGPAAARAISAMLDFPSDADWKRECSEALAIIRTEEAMRALVSRLGVKEVQRAAADAALRSPRLALPALAEQIARGSKSPTAESLLAMIVKQHDTLVVDCLGALPDAARRVVETMRSRVAAPAREATLDELPEALARPRWLQSPRTQKLAVGVTLSLEPLPFQDTMTWRPGQREEWLAVPNGVDNWLAAKSPDERARDALNRLMLGSISLDDSKHADERALRARIGELGADARWIPPGLLCHLPTRLAVLIWETMPADKWAFYYRPQKLLAMLETKAVAGLARIAAANLSAVMDLLLPFRSTRLAPIAAQAAARSKKARADGQRWLLAHAECAVVALIPRALGARGAEREDAVAALRFLASRGAVDVVTDVANRYGDDAAAAVRDLLAFDPLDDYPAKLPKLPALWQPQALTRPLLRDRSAALPISAVDAIGTMLAFSRLDAPYAGLERVKEVCDRASLAQMAWDLFSAWLMAGAPPKEVWAMQALGHLGDDDAARKLAALIREWPGEAAHARAVAGLDVLAAIGSDVALMHLHGIAQKVKFKGLQEKARAKIDEIAEARGLSPEELADRLVPDLGLDDDGSLTLGFGARAFRVGFDEGLRPYAVDDSGKRLGDLPKPNKTDDAELAKASVDTWKALKKDAKTIASSQLLRLELAMCSSRRWSADVFRTFLLEHPLLIHLVRRLVWGTYGKDGALASTFRVAEDRTLADENDAAFVLDDAATVGLVHPLEMTEPFVSSWSQIVADYEIIQPFAQLARETFAPTPDETKALTLARWVGLKVPTGKILGLDHRGWRRGPPQDGGVVCWYEKPLEDGLAVDVDLEPGIFTGAIAESPEQKLGAVGVRARGTWGDHGRKPFGTLAPVVFSELVRDLESLR